jgi:hypothetical protein
LASSAQAAVKGKTPEKSGPPGAEAQSEAPGEALVGEALVKFKAPNGLARVDGLDPKADEFLESLKKRFRLRVLAVYAEPTEYERFVQGLANRRASFIPRLALVSVPTRMDKKSYDQKAIKKEKRRYREWFSLAVNTRPLAWLMGRKANSRLKDKLGLDVGFSYKTGEETRRFDERDRSLSFTALATMDLYGAKSDFVVAASALGVTDKLVFLSWIEPSQTTKAVDTARALSLAWLFETANLNGEALKPLEDDD